MGELNLLDGEGITEAILPSPSLKIYFLLKWIAALVILLFGLSGFLRSLAGAGVRIQPGHFAAFVAFYVAVGWVACSLAYHKQQYWITNKRIVTKSGLFGYSMTSIPVDWRMNVGMTQNFFERMLGIANLKVETIPGAIGGEGLLRAVPKTEETIARIMATIKSNSRPVGEYLCPDEVKKTVKTEVDGIILMEGETVLDELRPSRMAKLSFFALWSAQYFLPTTILLLILAEPLHIPPPTAEMNPIGLIAGYLAAVFAASSLYCSNLRYWITDRRVITKSGLTGNSIAQIPYGQIAYTTVAQSIYDRALGLNNLYVKDTSGPRRYGRRGGILLWKPECQFIGIHDPIGAQNRILAQKSICGQ